MAVGKNCSSKQDRLIEHAEVGGVCLNEAVFHQGTLKNAKVWEIITPKPMVSNRQDRRNQSGLGAMLNRKDRVVPAHLGCKAALEEKWCGSN